MRNAAIGFFAIALLICSIPTAVNAQLGAYDQNFEGLVQTDPGALGADGWLIFANVFAPDGITYLYGYGVFPAPNSGPPFAFCTIAAGEGGPAQGAQQLTVFSDYNNVDHGVGNIIESNVFQEQTIVAGDVGGMWYFTFEAKAGDLAGSSTALAFIKTLDPNNGFNTTNFITLDTTSLPTTWGGYALSISIDPSLVGQILQIGFSNKATNYEPSGVLYDNISFYLDGSVATDNASWGQVKSLYR